MTLSVENGKRIGTITREEDTDSKVNWFEYEGKHYLNLRLRKRGDDGQWSPDPKTGISIRIRELPDLAAAIAQAFDLAESALGHRQVDRPRPRMPGRKCWPSSGSYSPRLPLTIRAGSTWLWRRSPGWPRLNSAETERRYFAAPGPVDSPRIHQRSLLEAHRCEITCCPAYGTYRLDQSRTKESRDRRYYR
jgi:hypothetical protein